eukprot:ANDGO_02933.mRNA.1 hypothetical protein
MSSSEEPNRSSSAASSASAASSSVSRRLGTLRPPPDLSLTATTTARPRFAPNVSAPRHRESKVKEEESSSAADAPAIDNSNSNSNSGTSESFASRRPNNRGPRLPGTSGGYSGRPNGTSGNNSSINSSSSSSSSMNSHGGGRGVFGRTQEAQGVAAVFSGIPSAIQDGKLLNDGISAAGAGGANALKNFSMDEDDNMPAENVVNFENVDHPPISFPRMDVVSEIDEADYARFVAPLFLSDSLETHDGDERERLFLMQLPLLGRPVRLNVYSDGSSELVMEDGSVCAVRRGTRCTFHQQLWNVEYRKNGETVPTAQAESVGFTSFGSTASTSASTKNEEADGEGSGIGGGGGAPFFPRFSGDVSSGSENRVDGHVDICGEIRTRLVVVPDVAHILSSLQSPIL